MANPWTSFKFYEQHCEVCSNKNHCTAHSICIRTRFMDQIAQDPVGMLTPLTNRGTPQKKIKVQ
jgi:hypothetical protein